MPLTGTHNHAQAAAQGLLFALGGYIFLSMGDALVKSMVPLWPATAIAALRYFIGAGGLGVISEGREGRIPRGQPTPPLGAGACGVHVGRLLLHQRQTDAIGR